MKKIYNIDGIPVMLRTDKIAQSVYKIDKNGRFHSFLEHIDRYIRQKTGKFIENDRIYDIFNDLLPHIASDFNNLKDN